MSDFTVIESMSRLVTLVAMFAAAALLPILEIRRRRGSRAGNDREDTEPTVFPAGQAEEPATSDPRRRFQPWMTILVSAVVLGTATTVIITGEHDSETKKWACGVLGYLLGYWLPRA